jgi:hypothetical protein
MYHFIASRNESNTITFVTVASATMKVLSAEESAQALASYSAGYLASLEAAATSVLESREARIEQITRHFAAANRIVESYQG